MSGDRNQSLLIIEDSDEDFAAFQRMMQKAAVVNPVYRCVDGDDALDYLYHQGRYHSLSAPRPSLIVLDLNLPATDGREVLAQIKQDENLKIIPVIIFSTSSNPKDVELCYRYGVNGYMLKPVDVQHLQHFVRVFANYWLEIVILPDRVLGNKNRDI